MFGDLQTSAGCDLRLGAISGLAWMEEGGRRRLLAVDGTMRASVSDSCVKHGVEPICPKHHDVTFSLARNAPEDPRHS